MGQMFHVSTPSHFKTESYFINTQSSEKGKKFVTIFRNTKFSLFGFSYVSLLLMIVVLVRTFFNCSPQTFLGFIKRIATE